MHIDQFWTIVEKAIKESGNDKEQMEEKLRGRLEKLPAKEVLSFHQRLQQVMDECCTWKLWGLAYVMAGGCSDDGFDYFRPWLVAQGRAVYEQVCKDPDSIANIKLRFAEDDEYEFEMLLGLAAGVYEELSGEDAYEQPEDPSIPKVKRLSDEEWDFDSEKEMRRRYPKTYAKYGTR